MSWFIMIQVHHFPGIMCKNPCSWNEISCSSSNSSMKGDPVQRAITGVIVFTYTHDKVSKKFYKGPASLKEMATQNATTHGPCRNNRDYIFLMEKALFEIGHEDDYIIELENEVRNVVGVLGHEMPNEKRILETTHSSLKVLASPRKLRPLPEAVAAIDSLLNQSEAKGNLMA